MRGKRGSSHGGVPQQLLGAEVPVLARTLVPWNRDPLDGSKEGVSDCKGPTDRKSKMNN